MLTTSHLLGQTVKQRWPPTEENFVHPFQSSSRSCTSAPVPYTTLIFSFCLFRLRKRSQPWKVCSDEILLDQFYINEHSKVFIVAVWPKKCAKLCLRSVLIATLIFISGMLTPSHFLGQKVKPRWPPMEANFGRVRLFCTRWGYSARSWCSDVIPTNNETCRKVLGQSPYCEQNCSRIITV